VRAQDGPLFSIVSSDDERKEETSLRLHELTMGVGRFHILVFTSNMLASNRSEPRSVKGIKTINALELEEQMDNRLQHWRSTWSYASDMHDGYSGKDLFKVHVIAGTADLNHNNSDLRGGLERLAKKAKGDGMVFLDKTRALHQKYGFSWNKGHGGIVVIRPDSHVGYRVNGVGEQAWKDVNEYFSSFLTIM
jgi:hypothetical protein